MTLLDLPETASPEAAQRLRGTTAAVRVSLRWLGVRKTLTPQQKTEAAEPFQAEGDYLSARKKLLDTRHPAFLAVTAVRGQVVSYWKSMTLPFPEPGVRLLRQEQVPLFNERLTELRSDLAAAVTQLNDHYHELRAAARQRLGRLYDASDYPPSLEGLFAIDWDFPSVEPPDYLRQLSPALFEQERARVASRFEEAVRLAEQAFLTEFATLVSHLCERLGTTAEGERKVFRDTAVTNLVEFFGRFKTLNVHSNTELDRLVEEAQRAVQGVAPQELRDRTGLRQHVATQLSTVQATLDGLLVDRPRRRLVRQRPGQEAS